MRGNLAYLNVLDCKAALQPRVSGVFKHGFLTLKHQAFEFLIRNVPQHAT